ncbi:MAG: SCP2 sterol-binding domain-containing protein [Gemmatimonadetes bacterium]|nr:SCP2 sterol-binding domain-containing protein [Gemmatimonadota bacterium]
MHRPFTREWADALRDAINADAAYASAAAKWTWPVALVLEANEPLGYPAPVAVELALERGRCHGVALIDPPAITAPFTLRASYVTWKKVVTGSLDAVTAVTMGEIKFTGALTTLLLHVNAAKALVGAARLVPTAFPDEAA